MAKNCSFGLHLKQLDVQDFEFCASEPHSLL